MYYWSSTEDSYYTNDAWFVNFDYGYTYSNGKNDTYDVRAVLAF